jgi:hypothetical protein
MKNKFGILDVLIILVVIVLAVIGIKVLSGQNLVATTPTEKVTFTVEIKGAEEDLVSAIKEGDIIYNSSKNKVFGTISNVSSQSSTEITNNIYTGEFLTHTYDDKYDIHIEIIGTAEEIDEKNITVAEEKLKIGSLVYISSDKFASSGYVIELKKDGER